jgi:chromosome segregation ATPase
VFSSEPELAAKGENSGSGLSRLHGILTRLGELNETLRKELGDSRKNSEELRLTLERLKTELDALRPELETLRRTSAELSNKAGNSEKELTALQEALTKAESSLTSLEQSFASYRQTAELRIADLEKEKKRWRVGFIAASVLAVGGFVFGIADLGR